MSEVTAPEATEQEVEAVIYPETAPLLIEVGGKKVSIVPMARRWEKIFLASALPMMTAELQGPEAIIKSLKDGSFLYEHLAGMMVQSHVTADKDLDRTAAIVLASQIEGSGKNPEKVIVEQMDWIQDHTRTEDLWKLVEAQFEKEDALRRVGERSPGRFARLLNLAGIEMTPNSLKQLLTNLLSRLQEMSTGAGQSAIAKPNGSSSDGSGATA